jgi:AraC-like DNA-binding protein
MTEDPAIHMFYPTLPLLQQHIAYYYFFESVSSFKSEFVVFPHTHIPLTIHSGASWHTAQGITCVNEAPTDQSLCLLQGMLKVPLRARFNGAIKRVTIVFKPLGINHFLEVDFARIGGGDMQSFEHWEEKSFNTILDTADKHSALNQLEQLLLRQYRIFNSYRQMQKALDLLTSFPNDLGVTKTAKALEIDVRQLNRLFAKHIGVSPITYKKIARFRHSVNLRNNDAAFTRLISLATASNFFDQAYFNKVYKELTESSPLQFFSQLEKYADGQLIMHNKR